MGTWTNLSPYSISTATLPATQHACCCVETEAKEGSAHYANIIWQDSSSWLMLTWGKAWQALQMEWSQYVHPAVPKGTKRQKECAPNKTNLTSGFHKSKIFLTVCEPTYPLKPLPHFWDIILLTSLSECVGPTLPLQKCTGIQIFLKH